MTGQARPTVRCYKLAFESHRVPRPEIGAEVTCQCRVEMWRLKKNWAKSAETDRAVWGMKR